MSTAIRTPRARPLAIRSGGPLRLVGAAIRRERIRTAIWVLVAGLLALATADAVPQTFGNPTARRTVVQLVTATPSLLAIRGLPDGTSEGALAFFEVFTYLAIVAGLMSVFLVIRLTRGDEDTGRAELLLAAPVRRRSPLVVGLIVAEAANLILGVLVAGGFALGGLPLVGSLLSGAAAAAVGSAYAGVAALAAQIAPTARAANGVAVGALAGTWALRAIGDAVGTRSADGLRTSSAWPSWLSPIGWGQHVAPFTQASGWPIVFCVAFAVLCAAAALRVQARRDLGASLWRERPGASVGRVRSSLALAWRLRRVSLLAWAIGAALLGVFAGSLGGTAVSALQSSPSVARLVATLVPGGQGALLDLFVAAMLGIGSVLGAAAGIGALSRAADDDRAGRSELLLAAPVSRVRQFGEWLALGLVAAALVDLVAGAVGAACFAAGGQPRFWSTIEAGAAQIPASVTLVAVAGLLSAVLPRASGWLSWTILVTAVVLGQFGGVLQIPEWARQVSPFSHTPGVPAAHVDWSGAWWLVAVTIVVGMVALVLARRQDTAR